MPNQRSTLKEINMSKHTRRDFLQRTALLSTAASFGTSSMATAAASGDYYRISTEETFGLPEIYDATAAVIQSNPSDEAGLGLPPKDSLIPRKLFDIGEGRIADMDEGRIDKQLLSLQSPGVQIFEADEGTELAALANDRIAEAVSKHPARLAGLISVAPQDPESAALEIERGMTKLGLHGVLINSYTKGEFLDRRKFWPIFEAAEAHNAAIYIHPRTPAPQMYEPFTEYNMTAPMWGFHVDISTHAVRLLLCGVFDQFPGVKIVLGHMGEGLPFWLNRLDTISARTGLDTIKRKPSEYFLDNFVITTSAMFWDPILKLSLEVLGSDRILFGVDYPYAPSAVGTRWLDAAPISEEVRRKIYSENAKRVFHIS
jgi:2,3-dihydroxybenzoate decarboxylase